jgi:hypothetical protein
MVKKVKGIQIFLLLVLQYSSHFHLIPPPPPPTHAETTPRPRAFTEVFASRSNACHALAWTCCLFTSFSMSPDTTTSSITSDLTPPPPLSSTSTPGAFPVFRR